MNLTRHHNGNGHLVFIALFGLLARPALADWPESAARSGTSLPDEKIVANIEGSGIYVPRTDTQSPGPTGMAQGALVWNLRLIGNLGLFGRHTLARMWWDNVSMLTLGNEIGARFCLNQYVTLEAAYLGHRAEREWIESDDGSVTSLAIGGVRDHGAEVGIWGSWNPLSFLRIEGHILGRAFRVYKDDQLVLGGGIRVGIMPWEGHAVILDLDVLAVHRSDPRVGVEKVTWNTLGKVLWRSSLTSWLGLEVGARGSTNWFCGEIPMLELKRSMIKKPMVLGFAGLYFLI